MTLAELLAADSVTIARPGDVITVSLSGDLSDDLTDEIQECITHWRETQGATIPVLVAWGAARLLAGAGIEHAELEAVIVQAFTDAGAIYSTEAPAAAILAAAERYAAKERLI